MRGDMAALTFGKTLQEGTEDGADRSAGLLGTDAGVDGGRQQSVE
jgi:hypothetical protein